MFDFFMDEALKEAEKSDIDIPVGCVIEKNGKIIAYAHNEREKINDVTAHAEILALRRAANKLNNWRLIGCNLYVTLEPCPMCMWAILNSRIEKVYFGAHDLNYGAISSKLDLLKLSPNMPEIYSGIMEEKCKELLDNYFREIRK